MRRQRRTKIVATLGPASSDRRVIASLFEAGADVFRINMSHTTHARMRELRAAIRDVEGEFGRPIGILLDLQGPKLRVGTFAANPATLTAGETFTLDADPAPGDAKRVQLPHPEIFAVIEPGHTLLLDDGKVRLVAIEADSHRILTRVEIGGKLSDRKGISLPDTTVPFSALTEKDRSDLEAGLDAGVDWVALSFIQRPEDIAEAKKITRGRAAVMAKIEKPQAINRLGEIMDLTDALMVARGDLGVEMPLEKVPGLQKQMTRYARRAGKPVVIATQMLESMITSPVPTRAEVSDVSTAIFDGADAIMLSGETAIGRFPILAAEAAVRIARQCEENGRAHLAPGAGDASDTDVGALTFAAVALARAEPDLAGIVCYTRSGWTARMLASLRPPVPIFAFAPSESVVNQLALVHGVLPRSCASSDAASGGLELLERLLGEEPLVPPGAPVVLIASTAQPDTGPNAIEVYRVP